MKKIFFLIFAMFIGSGVFAQNIKSCDLGLNSEYIILLDSGAQSFGLSDPNIISIQTVTTLLDDKEQVLIKPLAMGKTSVSIKYLGGEKNFVFNIVENPKTFCNDVIEIDVPEGAGE